MTVVGSRHADSGGLVGRAELLAGYIDLAPALAIVFFIQAAPFYTAIVPALLASGIAWLH